jgi:hypothetical protein
VGEEAAKLFGALQDWATESWARTAEAGAGTPTDPAAGLGAAFRHVDEHLARGDGSCTFCPVCQVITRLRATSPEVRLNLAIAARSLLEAAAGLLETRVPPESRRPGVQRIDLDDADDPDDPEDAARDIDPDAPPEGRGWDAD